MEKKLTGKIVFGTANKGSKSEMEDTPFFETKEGVFHIYEKGVPMGETHLKAWDGKTVNLKGEIKGVRFFVGPGVLPTLPDKK